MKERERSESFEAKETEGCWPFSHDMATKTLPFGSTKKIQGN